MLLSNFYRNKEFNFKEYVSNFNKVLNVAKHFRTIGGKRIPVRGHKRTVMRLRSALEDVRDKGTPLNKEYAYNLNPRTGIVGQRLAGTSESVNATFIPRNKKTLEKQINTLRDVNDLNSVNYIRDKNPRMIVHNHPGEGSSLSYQDIGVASKSNQVLAITKDGTTFRGYPVKRRAVKKLEQSFKDVLRGIEELNGVPREARSLLATHRINTIAKDNGDIFYRTKKSSDFIKMENKYGEKVYDTVDRLISRTYTTKYTRPLRINKNKPPELLEIEKEISIRKKSKKTDRLRSRQSRIKREFGSLENMRKELKENPKYTRKRLQGI